MASGVRLIDKDMGYKALSESLKEVGKHSSKAGLLKGTDREVLERAAKNHFGTDRIPARPWVTHAWDAGGVDNYADVILTALEDYVDNADVSAIKRGFGTAAAIAAHDQRDSILSRQFKPNAPFTLAHKKGDIPLIDSGEMFRAISFEVTVSDKPFKPADSPEDVARSIRRLITGGGPSRSKKRKRKVGFRSKAARGLLALAKDIGFEGKGIRKSPGRRRTKGIASRGVRRKGLINE